LIFKIGLSHLVKIIVPEKIEFQIIKINEIKFQSYDKELLGSFLNYVASIRFPDAYKGRGLTISNKAQMKLKKGKVKN
jgi:large subunit ribosomal protein L6